jgi:hypothetical protein
MIPDTEGKGESTKSDPGQLARVLELELIQKRAAWQRANARHRTVRTISILFLFIIIAGSLAALFFLFSHFR